MRKGKKGAIEVQFNWIFVLIVGALILVFFINISNAQRKNADQKLAFELLQKVDLIMNGALTIPETGQVFDMPKIPFELDCDRISTLGVSRQFPERILFGPDTLQGRKLFVWSKDWTVPYKISNFLYITTSDVRYAIITDWDVNNQVDSSNVDKTRRFYNSLPDNITKEITNLSAIKDKNQLKLKLIFLDYSYETFDLDQINSNLPSFIRNMPASQISGVYINAEDAAFPQTVRFIRKLADGDLEFENDQIDVYEDPMIFGSVFAQNREQFLCAYDKSFQKLYYVSDTYKMRESLLSAFYAGSSFVECDTPDQTRAVAQIESLKDAALAKDIIGIRSSADSITSKNNNALRSSCAAIY